MNFFVYLGVRVLFILFIFLYFSVYVEDEDRIDFMFDIVFV